MVSLRCPRFDFGMSVALPIHSPSFAITYNIDRIALKCKTRFCAMITSKFANLVNNHEIAYNSLKYSTYQVHMPADAICMTHTKMHKHRSLVNIILLYISHKSISQYSVMGFIARYTHSSL